MTTVTLLPNATITEGGTITGGAPNAHTAITDGSDATSIIIDTLYTFELSTFTLPAGAIVRSVTASGRGFGSEAGWVLFVAVRTAAGADVAGFNLTWPLSLIDDRVATPATTTITDQALIDGLRVTLQNPSPLGSSYYLYIAELVIPVIYVEQPTVAVTGPSGTILTATTGAAWTYTGDPDADGGGIQQRYQLKVFTSATYGAVGFDPATSVPAYDTGEVMASAPSATIGPLPDGVALKAYMRVAQNVNGNLHWSLWDDGPLFTIDTDPPQVATITATASGAAVKVRVTRDLAHNDWTHINVERSDDTAVTWRPVRGAVTFSAPDDTVIFYDYEHPEGIPLRYRARGVIIDAVSGRVLSQGPWKATSSALVWTGEPCGEWLRAPGDPAGAVLIEVMVDEATTTTQHRVGLLDVIGRASPVSVWDTPSLAAGVLATVTRSYTDGTDLYNLIRTAPVLLWQGRRSWGHPHRWMVVTDHTVSRHPSADPSFAEYREWEISYVEVDEPPVLS